MALTKRCDISLFCGPFYDGDAFGVPTFGFDNRTENRKKHSQIIKAGIGVDV